VASVLSINAAHVAPHVTVRTWNTSSDASILPQLPNAFPGSHLFLLLSPSAVLLATYLSTAILAGLRNWLEDTVVLAIWPHDAPHPAEDSYATPRPA
jgi:hypothetical protein